MLLPQQSSSRAVLPASSPTQPVPVTAVDALHVDQEPEAGPGEVAYRLSGEGLSYSDDEDPGHVVGAVAVCRLGSP